MIKLCNPDLVLHCGDIVTPKVLDYFSGLPMRFVYGNNDADRAGLKDKCRTLGFGEIDDVIEITHMNKKILAYHGTNPRVLETHIAAQQHDYVFHGHTHVCRDSQEGKTRVINPGALFSASRYTFAKLDLESEELEFVEVPR